MKSFEAAGVWFLPNQPDDRVAGTLSFSVDNGFTLRLYGALAPQLFALRRYPVIHGVVSESPFGRRISLLGCFSNSVQLGLPGIALETIHADYGFAGDEFVESDEDLFDGAVLSFAQLSTWLGYSGLKVVHRPKTSVSWAPPPEYRCDIANAVLRTSFGLTVKGGPPLVSLEEQASLSIREFENCKASELESKYVYPLRMLFTFASDKVASLERYSLLRNQAGSAFPLRFDRLYAPIPLDKSGGQKMAGNFLFLLSDVADRFESFVAMWFRFVESHPSFCTVFFKNCYEEHGFVETRFILLMQAVELFLQDEAARDAGLISQFEGVRSAALESASSSGVAGTPMLPSAIELAMPTRFMRLVTENWHLIREVVGADMPQFIERFFSTRNFVVHRQPLLAGALSGTDIYWLQQRVAAVVKVLVLRRLGFSDDAITGIVARNPLMSHLRMVKSPWETAKD